MNITKKTQWGFICKNCGHSTDDHGASSCAKAIRTEYDGSAGLMFMGSRKVTARIVCDCIDLVVKRVVVSSTKEWE